MISGCASTLLDQLAQVRLRISDVCDAGWRLHDSVSARKYTLPQIAAQSLCALDQVHREALVGQRQGGRHAGHAAADDQGRFLHRHLAGVQRLQAAAARATAMRTRSRALCVAPSRSFE